MNYVSLLVCGKSRHGYNAVRFGKQRVILAHANVFTRSKLLASLSHDNVPRDCHESLQ